MNISLLLMFSLIHIRGIRCVEISESGAEQSLTTEPTTGTSSSDRKRFNVLITNLGILQRLYTGRKSTIETDLDTETKAQICKNIIGNDFFTSKGIEVLAGPSKSEIGKVEGNEEFLVEIYPNIKLKGSLVSRPYEEVGFMCPSHMPDTEETSKFFISQEYNFAGYRSDSYIGGRFVFCPDTDEYNIYALAVQAAKAEVVDNIELYYVAMKEGQKRTASLFTDPLYKHHDERRYICLSVFNASRFDPDEHGNGLREKDMHIEFQSRTLSFKTREAGYKAHHNDIEFKEWTMSCQRKAKFVVSQAYADDRVLVYFVDRNTDRLFLDTLMSRIRLQRD